MKNSQEIAFVIKELAKSKQITIGKMLSDCELNINTLSTMQSGGYYPRLEALVKIADYLDVSVDYLLGRNEKDTGSRYNNISNIGRGATIGENNTSIQNVSQNALEFDKLLSSLEYKEQIRLMSHIYDWIDELKKKK